MNRFLWLIRREIWECKTIWVAPLACAAIVIAAALYAVIGAHSITMGASDAAELAAMRSRLTPENMQGAAGLAHAAISMPFFLLVMITQVFYAIDALYAERRDRSILFWKSLPLSDTETVLAKLTVASVVMPLFAIAAAIVSEVVVCALASTKLASLGIPGLLGALWSPSVWSGSLLLHVYVFSAAALWFLPVVAWALFVSSWAPRSPVMLATLIPLGIALAEFIALRSHYALAWMGSRVETTAFYLHAFRTGEDGGPGLGVVIDADTFQVPHSLIDMISPLDFISSPALWSGILVATALVASAIWIRRYRAASA